MLHSVPSFSIFNTNEAESGDEGTGTELEQGKEDLVRTVTTGESIGALGGSADFSFGRKNSMMGLILEEQQEGLDGIERPSVTNAEEKEPPNPPIYLATGLGISDGSDLGDDILNGVELSLPKFDGEADAEEYYKRLVDEYPCHSLVLANYAQLLQTRGDLHGAEEFYHRASLANPENGEILLQHAKLVWEVHRDQDRALQIFERAAQVAPQDSQILGAYASFLWEIDDDGEEDISQQDQVKARDEENVSRHDKSTTKDVIMSFQLPASHSVDVGDQAESVGKGDGDIEAYFTRMLEENPCNSLVLKNYARFLCQNKGDLQKAEEYYSCAVVADPGDGEIMSEYAKLVWELHRDHDKASHYHERAAQATPENSYVLASYASFLWETEDNEEDGINQRLTCQEPRV